MLKVLQQTRFPSIVLILLGVALVFLSYLFAGGENRLMPEYGNYYGCKFGKIDSLTFVQPRGDIEKYSRYEILGCLPPYYFLLYGFAIVGVVLCGWALVLSGKSILAQEKIRHKDFVNTMVALIASPLMILIGIWVCHLQISFGFGGSSGMDDLYDTVALILVLMGFLVIVSGVITAFVAESRGIERE